MVKVAVQTAVPNASTVGVSDKGGANAEEAAVRNGANGYRADSIFGPGELNSQEQSLGRNKEYRVTRCRRKLGS